MRSESPDERLDTDELGRHRVELTPPRGVVPERLSLREALSGGAQDRRRGPGWGVALAALACAAVLVGGAWTVRNVVVPEALVDPPRGLWAAPPAPPAPPPAADGARPPAAAQPGAVTPAAPTASRAPAPAGRPRPAAADPALPAQRRGPASPRGRPSVRAPVAAPAPGPSPDVAGPGTTADVPVAPPPAPAPAPAASVTTATVATDGGGADDPPGDDRGGDRPREPDAGSNSGRGSSD